MNATDSPLEFFYRDLKGNTKKNGIYCPVIDRWLLLDDKDFWVTLETAKALSSKIASMVYILPNNCGAMTNENCLNFAIFDKTAQKKGGSADLITGQLPNLRILQDVRQLMDFGYPEDYKSENGIRALKQLKSYADFVNKCMYSIMITQEYQNFHDNKRFSDEYLPSEFLTNVTPYYDRSDSIGIFIELKRICYESNSQEEALTKFKALWNNNRKVWWISGFFYKMLGISNIDGAANGVE